MWTIHDFVNKIKGAGETIGMIGARLSVDEEIEKSKLEVDVSGILKAAPGAPKPRLLSTAEMLKHYGNPRDPNFSQEWLTTLISPYPLVLDWAMSTNVNKFSIHKKVAPRMSLVMNDILAYYGYDKRVNPNRPTIVELGINQFAGCYNFRPQRGLEKKYAAAIAAKNYALAATYISRHGWAAASDWDADRNQLRETAKTARFARIEYRPMIDIYYKHGFISYGIERNNDWMHFEIGVIL